MRGCREREVRPPVNRALSLSRVRNGRWSLIAGTEFETIESEFVAALAWEDACDF